MTGPHLSLLILSSFSNRARLARIKQDQAKSISKRAKPLGRKFAAIIYRAYDNSFATNADSIHYRSYLIVSLYEMVEIRFNLESIMC
jgi:hypothetical protein